MIQVSYKRHHYVENDKKKKEEAALPITGRKVLIRDSHS